MSTSADEERDFWEERAGAWDRQATRIDRFSDTYGIPAMDALGLTGGERVLDVGCGPGTTAVALAQRVGPAGEVVALDISEAMASAARRRAQDTALTNVSVVVHDLAEGAAREGFDAAYSRFGVMFFVEPVASFANVLASLMPGGRLSCAVWAPLEENPWMFVPTMAAVGILGAELTLPVEGGPGPFSLSDPDHVRSVLGHAGFEAVEVRPVAGHFPLDRDRGAEQVPMLLELGPLGSSYARADEDQQAQARRAVLDAIEPYRGPDGWRIPGTAFVVTAERPGAEARRSSLLPWSPTDR